MAARKDRNPRIPEIHGGLRVILSEQDIWHDGEGHTEQQSGGGPATAMAPAAHAVRGVVHGEAFSLHTFT
jgi:hypothetical protein